MQTESLQEFIAVAKHASFRKAADELHLSQPALSNHIAALEREIGFQLFDRSGGARLTTSGAHFYLCAQQILDLVGASVRESAALAKTSPPVRLQMLGQEDSALGKVIAQIKTPFRVVPMSAGQLLFDFLDSGACDVLVTPYVPEPCGYACVPVGEVELSFLMSRENPLAAKAPFTRDDLCGAEILVPFGNLYDWMKDLFVAVYGDRLGVTYAQDPTVPVNADRIPLCDLGRRVVIAYRGAAHRAARSRSDLVVLDEMDGSSFVTREYLVYRADDANPHVRAFVEEACALVG